MLASFFRSRLIVPSLRDRALDLEFSPRFCRISRRTGFFLFVGKGVELMLVASLLRPRITVSIVR